MANEEWGTKRVCPKCGARFYDLNKEPITCIECGTEFVPEPVLKTKQPVAVVPEKKEAAPKAEEAEEDGDEIDLETDDDVALDDDDDDDVLADVSLDDDDADLSDVVQKPSDDEET
ncbi:MAG: TIGR02300 family protein [Pseudomonadota bacterium]